MASRRGCRLLSTAVIYLLVAASFAPSASAARMLQAASTVPGGITVAPVQTIKPTPVFGTVGPSPTFPHLPPDTDSCHMGTGSEVVCCPEETGYMRVMENGNPYAFACQKIYPVAQAAGELAGSDGSFPHPEDLRTDSWALYRDYYERPNGDILGRCFQSTKEILGVASYATLDPNMYLVTNTGRLFKAGELSTIEAWFESYFKDKKPTVQIFDVAFESAVVTNIIEQRSALRLQCGRKRTPTWSRPTPTGLTLFL